MPKKYNFDIHIIVYEQNIEDIFANCTTNNNIKSISQYRKESTRLWNSHNNPKDKYLSIKRMNLEYKFTTPTLLFVFAC